PSSVRQHEAREALRVRRRAPPVRLAVVRSSCALLHSALSQREVRGRRLLRLLVDAVNEHHGAVNDAGLLTLDVEEHPIFVPVEGRPHLAQSTAELTDERPAEGPAPLHLSDVPADLSTCLTSQSSKPISDRCHAGPRSIEPE